MKKIFGMLMLINLLALPSYTQDSIHIKPRIYKIMTTGAHSVSGYLASVNDSGIIVAPVPVTFTHYRDKSEGDVFVKTHSIDKVWLRRKNTTVRGILWGAVAGAATGAIAGLIDGDDYKKYKPDPNAWIDLGCLFCMSAAQKSVAYGVSASLTGALIGGIIGALAHKTFIIGGNRQNLDDLKFKVAH